MKVLATRRYPGPAFEELEDVEVGSLSARDDVQALIVANEPVEAKLFPSLRLVANFGVGYDRIGVDELGRRGVAVTNTPGVLDAATADLTWALILAVRRRVVEGDLRVRAGEWTGSWADGFLAEELTGSTLGIVGLGRIGSAVARRAEGFELRVVYEAGPCGFGIASAAAATIGRRLRCWPTRQLTYSLPPPRSSLVQPAQALRSPPPFHAKLTLVR